MKYYAHSLAVVRRNIGQVNTMRTNSVFTINHLRERVSWGVLHSINR